MLIFDDLTSSRTKFDNKSLGGIARRQKGCQFDINLTFVEGGNFSHGKSDATKLALDQAGPGSVQSTENARWCNATSEVFGLSHDHQRPAVSLALFVDLLHSFHLIILLAVKFMETIPVLEPRRN